MTRRILVAGIGNIFLGDDGFGSEVARRLLERPQPEAVTVLDIGIRGVDLAYRLLDGYDALILVDTVARGGPPGTLYLIAAEPPGGAPEMEDAAGRRAVAAHSMDPLAVLAFARALGARPIQTLVVGCEPAPADASDDDASDDEELRMGLSAPVRAAVEGAVRMVETAAQELLGARERVES